MTLKIIRQIHIKTDSSKIEVSFESILKMKQKVLKKRSQL